MFFLMFFPSFSSFLGLSKVMKLISVAGLTWVNTQFRAYPFYKASEWMPHKKLLLNSIVF